VHRYPDKVLFLALDVCPVYCRFCTRSYAVGNDTEAVEKAKLGPNRDRWAKAFDYLRAHPAIEDVVLSGGDAWMLRGAHLDHLLGTLLDIPHIRRIRIATKGLAVLPQKALTDKAWRKAVVKHARRAAMMGKHLCIHTHLNHPREITAVTRDAVHAFTSRGVVIRNQTVLQRGVNDDVDTMVRLVRRLAWVGVVPYQVYTHDLVPGVEGLRTTLGAAVDLEKAVRGSTAGFLTPTFVCDVMGGGGFDASHLPDREVA
jgi:lysine 2,3-aminomutase